jgi:hypothetical protein
MISHAQKKCNGTQLKGCDVNGQKLEWNWMQVFVLQNWLNSVQPFKLVCLVFIKNALAILYFGSIFQKCLKTCLKWAWIFDEDFLNICSSTDSNLKQTPTFIKMMTCIQMVSVSNLQTGDMSPRYCEWYCLV